MDCPPTAPVSRIPVDVFETILREFDLKTPQGKSSLNNCSLVSKAWRQSTLPQLFRSIHSPCGAVDSNVGDALPKETRRKFEDSWRGSEIWPLFFRLSAQPSLGGCVRELKLESVNFLQYIGAPLRSRVSEDVPVQNEVNEEDFVAVLRLLPRLRDLTMDHVVVTPSEDHPGFESRHTGLRLGRLVICFNHISGGISHEDDLGHIVKCFDEVDELAVSGYRGTAASRVFGGSIHCPNISLRGFDDNSDGECAPIYSALIDSPTVKTLSKLSLTIGPGESYPHAKALNALSEAVGGNLARFHCRFWAGEYMSDNEEGRVRLDHCPNIRYLSFDVYAPFPWRVIARLLETLPPSSTPARIEFRVFPVFRAAVAETEWTADTENAVALDLVLANLRRNVRDASIVFRFAGSQGPHGEALRGRFGGDFYRLNKARPVELIFE